jgi:hypothetical protein
MIGWYIEIRQGVTHIDNKYLNKVKEMVTPCMDHFCNRLNEIQFSNISKDLIFNEMKNIIEELPFLTFKCYEDDFWIMYNKNVDIRFNDGLKPIIREIKLSQILA